MAAPMEAGQAAQAMAAELEQARQQLAEARQQADAIRLAAQAEINVMNQRLVEEHNLNVRRSEDWELKSTTLFEAIGAGSRDDRERKPKAEPKPIFKKEAGEDYLIFQGHFDVWADLQGLSDDYKKKSLFTAFQGNAGRVARIFGPDSDTWAKSYKEYEAAVRSVFASKAMSEAAKSKFEVCVQGKAESCQEYAAEKMALFLIAYPASGDQSLLVREYIRGLLSPEIRKVVVRQAGTGFEQVVNHANNEEAAIMYLASLNRYERPAAAPGVTHQRTEAMDLSDMSVNAMDRGRDQHGRFSRRPRQSGATEGCWRCGDPNHFRRECPKPREGNGEARGGRGGARGGRGAPGRGGRGGRPWQPSTPNNNHRWRQFAAMMNDYDNHYGDPEHYYEAQEELPKQIAGPGEAVAPKADF